MKVICFLVFVITWSCCANESVNPPKQWWKEVVSIEKVESDDDYRIAKELNRFSRLEIKASTWNKEDSLNNSGRVQRLENTKSSDKLKEEFLESIRQSSIKNNSDWKKLKNEYHTGDVIYFYAAPPLSGPLGYILVRDGRVIFDIVIADQ